MLDNRFRFMACRLVAGCQGSKGERGMRRIRRGRSGATARTLSYTLLVFTVTREPSCYTNAHLKNTELWGFLGFTTDIVPAGLAI